MDVYIYMICTMYILYIILYLFFNDYGNVLPWNYDYYIYNIILFFFDCGNVLKWWVVPSRIAVFFGVVPFRTDLTCVSRDEEHICRTPHGRFTSFICVHLLIALPPPRKILFKSLLTVSRGRKKQKN